MLLRAEFWCKFSAGQQWGPPTDADAGSAGQRGLPWPVFWKSPVGSTAGEGLILKECKSSLWFEFSLLQTGASSHGTPLHPQDTASEKWLLALCCSLCWLKDSCQATYTRLLAGQLSYTWPGRVWMNEDCVALCFICTKKLIRCLKLCRN